MTVCLIEDDAAVRVSTRALLEAAGFEVQDYVSAEVFLADEFARERCDVIVSDIRMPGLSGLELMIELKQRGWQAPVILVTGHGDVPLAVRAISEGALDFLEKPVDAETLLQGVMRAMAKSKDRSNRDAGAQRAQAMVASLTPRELAVVEQLVLGHPNKVAAKALGISPRTVEIHRASIMRKFDAMNLADMARVYLTANPAFTQKLTRA
jgi:FixJ family two-component response regulator